MKKEIEKEIEDEFEAPIENENYTPQKPSNKSAFILIGLLIIMVGIVVFMPEGLMKRGPKVISAKTTHVIGSNYKTYGDDDKFAPDVYEIYALFELENVEEGQTYKANWMREGETIHESAMLIDEVVNKLFFTVPRPAGGFENGDYIVELVHDDNVIEKLEFSVVEEGCDLEYKTFYARDLGVYMRYNSNWMFETASNAVRFSGYEGDEDEFVTINLQRISSSAAGGEYESLESLYNGFKSDYLEIGGVVSEFEEVAFYKSEVNYYSIKFDSTFTLEGEEYSQVTHLIELNDNYFYQLAYTAPTEIYEDHLVNFHYVLDFIDIVK